MHDHIQLSVAYAREDISKCIALLPFGIIFAGQRNTEHAALDEPLH